jgi:hypothetical protein
MLLQLIKIGINLNSESKAWIVTADMGYGHQRAIYPLRDMSEEGVIAVGSSGATSASEKKLWKRVLGLYEFLSRAKSIPIIGSPLFNLLDALLHIPSFYPIRNLSNTTFQVNMLRKSILNGLCAGMLEKVKQKNLPIITSFYAPAIAADMSGTNKVYCIICDADLNRVWVAKEPWESRIEYFAPCGKAAQRLKAYGVPDERIYITGFPLPDELLGGKDLPTLKKDLGQRLIYLDPNGYFRSRHEKNVKHFLGKENYEIENLRPLTISYAVGGAGAQKEIGAKIAYSLKDKISKGTIKLNLIAGTREPVRDYFVKVKEQIAPDSPFINIIYSSDLINYFDLFNQAIKTTDILWTKPSELSFYSALGLPIIMTPPIGAQEKFNTQWLMEIQGGIKQDNPDYTDQWLFDFLDKGRLAEAAWSGFLKVRKLGTYNIKDIITYGSMNKVNSPVLR